MGDKSPKTKDREKKRASETKDKKATDARAKAASNTQPIKK